MSGPSSSRNKALIAGIVGALGAGALIAGAGMLLYNHLEEKKKYDRLQQKLDRGKISRNSSIVSSSVTENDSEYFSCRSSDTEDDFLECFSDAEKLKEANLAESLFLEVDVLMKGNSRERSEAFNKLKSYKKELSKNVEFLWRLAKAHQMEAAKFGAQKNLEKKKELVMEGLKYAREALLLDESKADVHKWFAILTGMEADFVSIKEKIQKGHTFQKHILLAIEMKPSDYSLHHLLGRFKFEIAKTTWMEKKMAAQLFGKLPDVTYDDAIKDLLKAEKLNPTPWKENRLLLAKCNLSSKNYSLGVKWLNSAKEVTPLTEEDYANDREITELMHQYKNYV